MQLSHLTIALGLASAASCLPSTINADDAALQGLSWTGAVVEGGENVTCSTGQPRAFSHQIKGANIYFKESPIPEVAPSKVKRQAYGWGCDRFPNEHTPKNQAIDQINYLYRIGGGVLVLNDGRTLQPRISCSYNSGIWIWPEPGPAFSIPIAEAADVASTIVGRCDRGGSIGANAETSRYYIDVKSTNC